MFKAESSVDPVFAGTTPQIDESTIKELLKMDAEILGGPWSGVVRFPNAIHIDQDKLRKWIDENAQTAHQQRWEYRVDEAGVTYAVNEDGNKFSLEQINEVPVRVLEPVRIGTEPEFVHIFREWEDAIYKCLIKYVDIYPMVLGTLWWRSRGHVIRYDVGNYLGIHNDNDSNFRSSGGVRYIPKGQVQMRQVVAVMLYVNDCVDPEEFDGSNYSGGELTFPYLGIEQKPKSGDIVIFPTNYIATHGVNTVTHGQRYCYLEFWSQGSSHDEVLVNVAEPNEVDSWCRPHWIDNLYDDYSRYSMFSEFENKELVDRPNPVYQNRTLEGENGLSKPYSHTAVNEANEMRGKINPYDD
jgi:hypothetical protein